jgi:hypothetical protein
MLIEHAGKRPVIDASAWIAPDATVCGDVVIAAGARILHGARLIGEKGGRIGIGRNCIVMENAVVRSSPKHPWRPALRSCTVPGSDGAWKCGAAGEGNHRLRPWAGVEAKRKSSPRKRARYRCGKPANQPPRPW